MPVSSHGTTIGRASGGAQTFTEIAEVGDITMPGLSRNEFDVTNHNDDIDAYVLGVLRRDPVSFALFFNKDQVTHADQSGLQKAIIDNSLDGYKITQPDGMVWIFSGRVQAMQQAAPVDGIQTANVVIRPTGLFMLNGTVVGNV